MRAPTIAPPEWPTQHPTIRLELSEADLRFEEEKCDLYVLLQLPPALFVDPYQLATTASLVSSPSSPAATYGSIDVFGQAAMGPDMRQPIELEKAVGWSDPEGVRRRQARTRNPLHHAYPRASPQLPKSFRGLEKEFTLNVLRIELPARTKGQDEASEKTLHTLELPLQARYLPPLPSHPPTSLQGWWELIKKENYERAQFPKPQLMYSCLDDGGPEITKEGWEYSVKSAMLAPEWALLSPKLKPLSNKERDLLVFTDPEGSSRLWSLLLPRGDQSVYEPVQIITLATSVLASLYIVYSVLATALQAKRKEAELMRACNAAAKSQ